MRRINPKKRKIVLNYSSLISFVKIEDVEYISVGYIRMTRYDILSDTYAECTRKATRQMDTERLIR